jgi:biotin transport system substrate-specific component
LLQSKISSFEGEENLKLPARDLVLIALFASLTAVMALFVSIPLPFSPVPLTGQTFAVMLAGSLLGARRGAMSQLIYILIGAVGLPVFSQGMGGLGVLVGPTGGFLWGFVLGAYIIGRMVERRTRPSLLYLFAATATGGVLVVYTPGIIQLSLVAGLTLSQAAAAMLYYLPGDVIKIIASSLLAYKMHATGLLRVR